MLPQADRNDPELAKSWGAFFATLRETYPISAAAEKCFREQFAVYKFGAVRRSHRCAPLEYSRIPRDTRHDTTRHTRS